MTRREHLVREIRHRKRAARRAAERGHARKAHVHSLTVAALRRELAKLEGRR